ncbi:MAG: acyltransferase [Sphingobacteriales bacterium JAD_PAG50586_3]|nr:MAG: acyltransferase [Sphingobacteriales bacterium JAD_PAG50586_3]
MRFHLRGLDGFRAIAATVVLISHFESFKIDYSLSLINIDFFKFTGGHTAVTLFFSLSGFLITLLLLREKEKSTISLKKFYLRRIFRVWPLYYFILLVSALLLAYTPSLPTLLLCLSIFPNIAHALTIGWYASPIIWSIGVEEQFYLFWPLVVKKIKSIVPFLVLFFIGYSLLPHVIVFFANRAGVSFENKILIERIFDNLKFNCMAVGSLFAVLYYNKSKYIRFLSSKIFVCNLLIVLPFMLWAWGFHIPYFTSELYALLFSISILNISTSDNAKINLDNGLFKFLGKISYGIYMYHWVVLALLFKYGIDYFKIQSIESNAVLYSTGIIGTIIIATLSYHLFELPFLKLKEKYSSE